MGARGPRSSAELAVVGTDQEIEVVKRPAPPEDLSRDQRVEWVQIVNDHPADRFPRETWPMLAAHCRHVDAQTKIGQLIDVALSGDEFDTAEYDRLLKMQERETRCLASLAVRLGFAYSTAYEKRPAKGPKRSKPWES